MINPNRNFLLQNLKKMISIPSINPFGVHEPGKPAEGEIADYFENCLLGSISWFVKSIYFDKVLTPIK